MGHTKVTGILAAVCIAILVVMALALARAFNAPTVYDRILGVNMFGTKTVLFIAAIGFHCGKTDIMLRLRLARTRSRMCLAHIAEITCQYQAACGT